MDSQLTNSCLFKKKKKKKERPYPSALPQGRKSSKRISAEPHSCSELKLVRFCHFQNTSADSQCLPVRQWIINKIAQALMRLPQLSGTFLSVKFVSINLCFRDCKWLTILNYCCFILPAVVRSGSSRSGNSHQSPFPNTDVSGESFVELKLSLSIHKNVAITQLLKANPLLVSSDTVVQMGTEKNTSAEEDNNFFSNSMTLALMFYN